MCDAPSAGGGSVIPAVILQMEVKQIPVLHHHDITGFSKPMRGERVIMENRKKKRARLSDCDCFLAPLLPLKKLL